LATVAPTADREIDPHPDAPKRPELLAPAGDRTCLLAAVENGADAVYFGLKAHNARARAVNFDLDDLPEIMGLLHRRGVKGYVTLNTLLFPAELEGAERLVRRVAEAGVDALIVQDLGLCRIIRAVTPDLEIHASTQMSVTSVEGVRLARELGCSRVILARELSVGEIARVARESPLPLEVFVHGALCVAYSGQCLTSEALGGRSANRGECAQACRMPYEVICDGKPVDLGDVKYLLSPQDLAAYDVLPKLIELGVSSLKIEGRLKSPEYVASITAQYRKVIDATLAGRPTALGEADVREMEMTFSRGFSHGFLDGNNHKVLVRGDYAKKRGLYLGRVEAIRGDRVRVTLASPVKPGDGVVFDAIEAEGAPEQGGRVYELFRPGRGRGPATPAAPGGLSAGPAELAFGRRDIDPRRLRVGQRLWKTDDPELTRKVRASFAGAPHRRMPVDVAARAVAGEPLTLSARTDAGTVAEVRSDEPLPAASQHPATAEAIRRQVDRLGDSVYALRDLELTIEGGPMVPASLLNALRRSLVAELDRLAGAAPSRAIAADPVVPALRGMIPARGEAPGGTSELAVLCRTHAQAEAALAAGVRRVTLEYHDIKRYADSVKALRERAPDASVWIATPRIQKPGEAPLFRYLAGRGADGLLVRNAGGLAYCLANALPFVADFALNAANELAVALMKERGAARVTASYDLSFEQLDDLARAVPPGWLEVVIHQHMPMFHMEHCVFCAFLSPGTDKTNCGRPCDDHAVQLRDRVGMEHPLHADVGCRNTLYNAVPQTAAEYLPRLLAAGVGTLRVEFLEDTPEAVARTLALYQDALAGRRDARTLWKDLKATNRYGVTRGQLAVL
jgi:putative protease